MRAGSLLTRVRRVEGVFSPRGELVVVQRHSCQTDADLEARASAALGRERRRGDLLITIEITEDPCPKRRHQHHDHVIVHPRVD